MINDFKTSDFNYDLPEELIAQTPILKRDHSRLLVLDKATGEMVDWLEPYEIVTFDEIKIGVIGIIGDVESSILRTHVEDYDFVDPKEIVKNLATELRTEKECDVVIVAVHGDDDALNASLASFDGNSKIDGIFTGHTH